MILVTFDNWASSDTGSRFVLGMSSVPRVDEVVSVHRSMLPAHYLVGDHAAPEDQQMIDLKVRHVEYEIRPERQIVLVDFEYEHADGLVD